MLDNRTVSAAHAPLEAQRDPRDPRQRLEKLFDDGTFGMLTEEGDDSGALAGSGRIEGTFAVGFASDARIQGGALGHAACANIVHAYEVACDQGVPIIGLWQSGGARLREGAESLHGVGRIFKAMIGASGRIPQISVVLGANAGGAAYGPALTDVVILAEDGRVFVTGPEVVRSVTGEDVDMATLGGPEPHGRRSGLVHLLAGSATDALSRARRVATLLGSQGRLHTVAVSDVDFADLLPTSAGRAYSVHGIVERLLDEPGVELQAKWAPNLVTTLGRLGGRTVGVLANNPLRLGGCLDAASADKGARFVRMCSSFGVPLIVLVDVPGYLPGLGQEWDGVVRRGAKLLYAFSEAEVPRVTLVSRKAYGGAYIAMNSRSLGATRVLAWPTAEVAVMGATAAVRILHRRRLAGSPEPERAELEAELATAHERHTGGIDRVQQLGLIDEVISPEETRGAIARAICAAPSGRGTHGNIPL